MCVLCSVCSVHTCAGMCKWGGERETWDLPLSPSCCLETGFLTEAETLFRLGWLGSELVLSACFCPTKIRLQAHKDMVGFGMWVLRIPLLAPMLAGNPSVALSYVLSTNITFKDFLRWFLQGLVQEHLFVCLPQCSGKIFRKLRSREWDLFHQRSGMFSLLALRPWWQ